MPSLAATKIACATQAPASKRDSSRAGATAAAAGSDGVASPTRGLIAAASRRGRRRGVAIPATPRA